MHLPPGEVRNRDTSRAPRLDLGVIDTKSSPGRLPCYDQSDSQFVLSVTSSAVPHQSGHPPLTPSDCRFLLADFCSRKSENLTREWFLPDKGVALGENSLQLGKDGVLEYVPSYLLLLVVTVDSFHPLA